MRARLLARSHGRRGNSTARWSLMEQLKLRLRIMTRYVWARSRQSWHGYTQLTQLVIGFVWLERANPVRETMAYGVM